MDGFNDKSPDERMRDAGGTEERFGPEPSPHGDDDSLSGGNGTKQGDAGDIVAHALAPIDPTTIPPRPWVYANFLMIGAAGVLGAVDGGGKGSIAVAMMLSIVTGRPLLGERVWRSGRVAIISYEDQREEWHRRIAAACSFHNVDYAEALTHIRFLEMPGAPIVFASRGGNAIIYPHRQEIVGALKGMHAIALFVDPFNHTHDLEDGNSNALMAKVAGEVTRVAGEASVAALCLHHVRKGSNGDADDLMGATSLRATFRSCRILQRMDEKTATGLKIKDSWRYMRISGSKENYAPPPDRSTWFKLETVALHNVSDLYPEGDCMGVATRYTAPSAYFGLNRETLQGVFDDLRAEKHSPSPRSKHVPWAGEPLMHRAGKTSAEAAKIIKDWLAESVLMIDQKGIYLEDRKRSVPTVTPNDDKVASILADMRAAGALQE